MLRLGQTRIALRGTDDSCVDEDRRPSRFLDDFMCHMGRTWAPTGIEPATPRFGRNLMAWRWGANSVNREPCY
jgi:hypothetical protein